MSDLANVDQSSDPGFFRPEMASSHRSRPLFVLFVHHDAAVVADCLGVLGTAGFVVTHDVSGSLAQSAMELGSRSYDVVIAEYPGIDCDIDWNSPMHDRLREIPLLLVTNGRESESPTELTACGSLDFVGRDHLGRLPLVVRRALKERKLRGELEEARRALRHSQSLYRALVDNPSYGICRCDADGNLADVNRAFVTMLGYETKEELLAAACAGALVLQLGGEHPAAGYASESPRIEPQEIDWRRKNGATLKVRLSGRGVYDEYGNFSGREVIAVDVTEQRTLEDLLRHQASSDSLTGLANHRRLFEVLHAEIRRSKRTGREFCLVLLDLDGLKEINDRFSHLVGDQALCRLGQILKDCCRSVDTAARHGGDEFALVLPETGLAAATLVAHRVRRLLQTDGEEPALSVSVGVANYPGDAETLGTLLYAADAALYAMKGVRSARAPVHVRSAVMRGSDE